MKICIVAEGCYPYAVGGVSSWIHSMVKLYPNVEFVLLALIANRSQRGKFKYELPENLTEVYEIYLDDMDWNAKKNNKKLKLSSKESDALRSLVFNKNVDWDTLFTLLARKNVHVNNLLMGPDFLKIAVEFYETYYNNVTFADFLWTLRSVYLPLFTVMKGQVPKADLYHCVATGYAGILGCMGQYFHKGKLLISEHGLYTREREEELIKADWIGNTYRNIWIQQFKKMSKAAYERADMVTSLYEYARTLQIELGCPEEKIKITPNGIAVSRMENIPGKLEEEDLPYVNIGAVLRVAPIKDVKTLIQAFAQAKEQRDDLKLWIMGPWEEERDYAEECFQMVSAYGVKDVVFTDRVDVTQYLGRMDLTILTSISEGQPLTVLESYAAHKPVICTDVGCCRELIYGNNDGFGTAGILTHIMDVEEIAQAMLTMAANPALRAQMGENGYRRVNAVYHIDGMKEKYLQIYRDFCEAAGKSWPEKKFEI